MSLTFQQAIAQEHAKVAADFKAHAREAVRSRGVSFSGMGPGAYEPLTDAEINARARVAVRKAAEFEASPAARFMRAAQLIAKATGDERLLSCWSRGLDGNTAPALAALADMEALGADVTKARAALADLTQSEAA